jgi:hypothetical protein
MPNLQQKLQRNSSDPETAIFGFSAGDEMAPPKMFTLTGEVKQISAEEIYSMFFSKIKQFRFLPIFLMNRSKSRSKLELQLVWKSCEL